MSQILRHSSSSQCDGDPQQVADEETDRSHVACFSRSRISLPVLPHQVFSSSTCSATTTPNHFILSVLPQLYLHNPQSVRYRFAPDLRRPLRRFGSLSTWFLPAVVRSRLPGADDSHWRHVRPYRRDASPTGDNDRRQRCADRSAAREEQTQSNAAAVLLFYIRNQSTGIE